MSDIIEAVEMNTKGIAHLNQNLNQILMELRVIKAETMAMRRNLIYLKCLEDLKVTVLKG